MSTIELHNIHYNARVGAFQARADVKQGGATRRFACQLNGPASMQMGKVCQGLSQHALWVSSAAMAQNSGA